MRGILFLFEAKRLLLPLLLLLLLPPPPPPLRLRPRGVMTRVMRRVFDMCTRQFQRTLCAYDTENQFRDGRWGGVG